MKNFKRIFILIVGAVVLTGCPLSYNFPIDQPSVRVDPGLYGKYKDPNGESNFDKIPSTLTIAAGTVYSYTVIESYPTKDLEGNVIQVSNEYSAHISKIKGTSFVNLCRKGDDLYWFYKMDTKGTNLLITEVSCLGYGDDWISKNSRELKIFLGKYIKEKRMYGDSFELIRQ